MKKQMKRLALFLCIILTMPAVLGCLPMTALTAQAATPSTYYLSWVYEVSDDYDWETGTYNRSFQAEAGQKIRLDYMLYTYNNLNYDSQYLCNVSGETYASSNAAVATVSSDGELTLKKAGATTLTVTYKGTKTTCTLNVVAANGLGSSDSKYKAVKQAVKAMVSCGTTVTVKNRYKLWQAMQEIDEYEEFITNAGFVKEAENGNSYVTTTEKLVLPDMLQVRIMNDKLYEYVAKNNPIGTNSSKWFKINKVSAKKNSRTITLTLKKKVTTAQIFAIKNFYSSDSYNEDDGRALFPIWVKDKASGRRYKAWALAKKNSKKITITLDYHTLKKGKTYQLIGAEYWYDEKGLGWTKGKTFKAK